MNVAICLHLHIQQINPLMYVHWICMGSIGGNLCNSAMCIQLASKPSLFFAWCTIFPEDSSYIFECAFENNVHPSLQGLDGKDGETGSQGNKVSMYSTGCSLWRTRKMIVCFSITAQKVMPHSIPTSFLFLKTFSHLHTAANHVINYVTSQLSNQLHDHHSCDLGVWPHELCVF